MIDGQFVPSRQLSTLFGSSFRATFRRAARGRLGLKAAERTSPPLHHLAGSFVVLVELALATIAMGDLGMISLQDHPAEEFFASASSGVHPASAAANSDSAS